MLVNILVNILVYIDLGDCDSYINIGNAYASLRILDACEFGVVVISSSKVNISAPDTVRGLS